jgi:hypothetical protein
MHLKKIQLKLRILQRRLRRKVESYADDYHEGCAKDMAIARETGSFWYANRRDCKLILEFAIIFSSVMVIIDFFDTSMTLADKFDSLKTCIIFDVGPCIVR